MQAWTAYRRTGIMLAGAMVGVASVATAFDWDEPALWIPDLVAGLAFTGLSASALPHARHTSMLAALAALAWFAGTLLPAAAFWHRGVLLHLIFAVPVLWPRSRARALAIVTGYAASATPLVWGFDDAVGALAAAVFAGGAIAAWATAPRPERTPRRWAALAAGVFATAVIGGAVARGAVPAGDAVVPSVFVYAMSCTATALLLGAAVPRPGHHAVADRIVELGDAARTTFEGALAATLGDAALRVARWDEPRQAFVTDAGERIDPAAPPAGRRTTRLTMTGGPDVVVVHDPAVLDDPVLVESVTSAARLSIAHDELVARLRAAAVDVEASRARIVEAADDEHTAVRRRLDIDVLRPLAVLAAELDGLGSGAVAARDLATRARDEVEEIGRGLDPIPLEGSLTVALRSLASISTLPTEVDVEADVTGLPRPVETAAYYVCTEALANAHKHAGATRVAIRLRRDEGMLEVVAEDDGTGDARLVPGGGLAGLAERVLAAGGSLAVLSTPGAGTRVTATFPLPAE